VSVLGEKPIRAALRAAWIEVRETIRSADSATRALTWAAATTCVGAGLFYAVSAVFFSTVIGLSAAQIGAGLGIAGVAGVFGALAGGYLAARIGSYRTLVGATVLVGLLTGCYTFAGDMAAFVVLAAAISALRYVGTTARAALIALVYTGPDRVRVRARMRVVANASVGVGALLAGIGLVVGTAFAFRITVVTVGVLIVASTLPLLFGDAKVRLTAPDDARAERRRPNMRPLRSPFTDVRYLAVAFLVGVNATYFALLDFGLPLWITQHTAAPDVVVSILLVINTGVVILTQTAASKGTHEVRRAGRAALRGALLIAVACTAFALSGVVGALAAIGLLLVGALLMSGGEALGEAGSWGLTMELADPANQPRYQGVAEMAYAMGQTVGPLLISATALRLGGWGWTVLAAMFAAAGIGLHLLAASAPVRVPDGDLAMSGPG
jgi:MFS family permease